VASSGGFTGPGWWCAISHQPSAIDQPNGHFVLVCALCLAVPGAGERATIRVEQPIGPQGAHVRCHPRVILGIGEPVTGFRSFSCKNRDIISALLPNILRRPIPQAYNPHPCLACCPCCLPASSRLTTLRCISFSRPGTHSPPFLLSNQSLSSVPYHYVPSRPRCAAELAQR
jgi:hypothetical protein